MSEREPCGTKADRHGTICLHEKASHHPITEIVNGAPVTTHHACLASFCGCEQFLPMKKSAQ